MLFNEFLFPRKRSPFPKRGRHSLSPSERIAHSAEICHCLPLWGRWRRKPTEEVRLPFYFYFNSATIATIIEIIEAIAANNPNK